MKQFQKPWQVHAKLKVRYESINSFQKKHWGGKYPKSKRDQKTMMLRTLKQEWSRWVGEDIFTQSAIDPSFDENIFLD